MSDIATKVMIGLPITLVLFILILLAIKLPAIFFIIIFISISYLVGFVLENLGV